MKLIARSLSKAGPKEFNQDHFLEPTMIGSDWWCAIADGVGGSDAGEIASRLCIEGVESGARETSSMRELFGYVADYIVDIVERCDFPQRIGSTLTVLKVSGQTAFVGHVGDSRISHYRGSGILSRTVDQTEVQRLLNDGTLTKYQAKRYPRKNVLLSYMSPTKHYDLFETEFEIRSGDRILLTTDGFHEKLRRREISRISLLYPNFSDFFEAIEHEISNIALTDDATCVAVEVC